MSERFRWKVWGWLCKLPFICPANAHTTVVYGDLHYDPRISATCRSDAARNGDCWCGRVSDPVKDANRK